MAQLHTDQELTRAEVAHHLREFADQLDTPGRTDESQSGHIDESRVTILAGDESATIDPPERLSFEIAVESDEALIGEEAHQSVEFLLHWEAEAIDDQESDAEITIV